MTNRKVYNNDNIFALVNLMPPNQSKPTCFFSVIMNHYILPLPLLMGKPQKLISTQAVHKVWHLIVGGIEKLDYQSDAQLQKVFTDLIVKWIPQFRLVSIKYIRI